MIAVKSILFDTDGVLALPKRNFSKVYAETRGLDIEPFADFFSGVFNNAKLGKADLKELILANQDVWHFDGDMDELLKEWFDSENVKNKELIDLINILRESGVKCYLATSQEKYRADYLQDTMFKDELDGFFVSCDLGVDKNDPEFFKRVVNKLNLAPEEIAFFDDSQSNVNTAKSVGIKSFLYNGIEELKKDLVL